MNKLGPYQLTGELGRGGMGVVFRGFDPLIQRNVAIKTLRLDLSQPEEYQALRQRLLREAQAAGQLSHPGIVTVYQIGEQDGLTFIAMEYVDGLPLSRLLGMDRRLARERVISFVTQAASALDYAHQAGVIHRDIKPANLMITADGRLKVTDFGIAKFAAGTLTLTGTMLGSPSYMSPEQVQARTLDGRSDQYSLAVVAFEMLTGEKPFQADTLTALAFKIAYEDPPVEKLVGQAPTALVEVLRRGMAKNPADRYPTCAAFAEAFARAWTAPEAPAPPAQLSAPAPPAQTPPLPSPPPPAALVPPTPVAPASAAAVPAPAPAPPPTPRPWTGVGAAVCVAALVLTSIAVVRHLNRPAPPPAEPLPSAAAQPIEARSLSEPVRSEPAPPAPAEPVARKAAPPTRSPAAASPEPKKLPPAPPTPKPEPAVAPPSSPAVGKPTEPEPEPAVAVPIPVVEVPKPNPRAPASVDTPASLLHAVNPAYTESALRRGVEGAVRLAIEIDESGQPTVQRVIRSLDPELDVKAAEAVARWRFRPAMKDGKPVRMTAEVETFFRLQSKPSGPPSLRKKP